ncbi:M1 family metallopeptidase [Segetibacter sp.]|uniref:M1 family metallopeptidase n=1 Tax=Segetibacter sp. TaxID=2231182 RepID=UPI002623E85F|nr:M1 family metallopeptidase [Segetibacter sp.]MCW3079548.1 family metallopeptidase [Segetibacter sp.]
MRKLCISIIVVLLIASFHSVAQQALPTPNNIQKLFASGTRTQDGRPGPKYWQNAANYEIAAILNPSTLLLKGAETITYTNNSPDTLFEIVFKLYPNIFQKGAERETSVAAEDIGEGMIIDGISVANSPVLTYSINGTNMKVAIPPMLPKQHIVFHIKFHYSLNSGPGMRTGQVEKNTAFVAYFFPRIAVYDDIDGWNMNQYVGTQEFYNDFCNFKATVTVPKNFVVWATGDLKNCNEVFTDTYCNRIKQAELSDSVIDIIAAQDLAAGNITTDQPINTWVFEAKNVTDFVFATSDHYVWKSASLVVDSTTGRRTRADAVFNPTHTDYNEVINYNLATLQAMSYSFPKWPYPYSHETVFDGLDQMEYPMMVNDNPTSTAAEAITLTDHEIFHTMFPFYMGINETKYGWMDEGWATMAEWLISPMIDSTIIDTYGLSSYENAAGKEIDMPVTTLSTQLSGAPFFLNSYVKPALGYLYIKDYLGDEVFTKALHYYINQWQGKHPMPYDFFNCMNTGSGKNLNWFWKRWFFDNGVPDQAISNVKKKGNKYEVTITLKGTKPVPVDLQVTLEDNTVIKQHKSIEVWQDGNTTTKVSFKTAKGVTKIVLGSTYAVDIHKADNTWTAK